MTDTNQGAVGDARKRAQEAASASLSAEQPSEASPEVPTANGPQTANRVVAHERLDPEFDARLDVASDRHHNDCVGPRHLVRRTVTSFPDVVGPWLPVEDGEE